MSGRPRDPSARDTPAATRYLVVLAVAILVVVTAVWLVRDASLTYDEAVYVDLADHPLWSNYYPDDPFLRHPPLPIYLLAAWSALGLPLRAWALPWTLAGLAVTTATVRAHRAPPWLALVPVAVLPLLVPLVSVTMYPLLFLAMAVTAHGRATGRRRLEVLGWNAAVLVHELALVLLAFVLVPRLVHLVRTGVRRLRPYLDLLWPYPVAIAWGLVMVWGVVQGGDPRGAGILEGVGSPTAQVVVTTKPWHVLVMGLALAPLLVPLLRAGTDRRTAGARAAALFAMVGPPFYRYLVAPVPLLVAQAAERGGALARGGKGMALFLVPLLASSGLAWTLAASGTDSINAADIPGLFDHDAAANLVGPGERVGVRDTPALAYALQQDGWQVVDRGADGPNRLVLAPPTGAGGGDDVLVLHRVETPRSVVPRVDEGELDAVLVPPSWDDAVSSLLDRGWRTEGGAGGLVRVAAPGAGQLNATVAPP